ncbi:MAG: LysM peptidoglycan-binding domain-containing protein [Opitutaceae bacterium]|jgi:LysM repeat protein|nr:LysM peptidoglycan-binding domain-containing protein [Opitutaceae bacterium]
MKILKMIGLVVAVHIVVLTFGFILPGCQSTARTSPSSSERTTDSNLSRIDAARAAGAVGQPAAYTPDYTPAPARAPGGAPAYTPPPPGPVFTGGPVTDFSTPVSAPARPQNAAEAPALPAADAAPPEMLTYTVATGDSLWKISRKFKVKSADILSVNNLSNSSLQVGQKLKIPAKTISSRPGLTAQPGSIVYKVQANDSLGIIARRHNTTVAQIQSLNKLSGASIRIGQELLVPVIADAPDSSAPPPAADAPAPQSVTITHIVKPGENLDGIARHYGTTAKEIGIANHIPDPRRLQAGKKLTINARKNVSVDTPSSTPAATPPDATGATQSTPPPTSTPPPPPPSADTSPVNPISPVTDSPVAPAAETPPYDTPPVNTPLDPVTSPVGIPQN